MGITIERDGDLAVITMDDGKANAMGPTYIQALNGAFDAAESDSAVKAVILTGRDGVFTGGFDLKIIQNDPEAVPAMINAGGAMVTRMFTFPKPFIIAATGHAIALGAVYLLAADTRIGRSGAYRVGLNETAIGMVLPAFAREVAAYRVPKAKLTEAALQSKIYNHEGAVDAGFFDEVTSDPLPTAKSKALELTQLPGEIYALQKKAMRADTVRRIEEAQARSEG